MCERTAGNGRRKQRLTKMPSAVRPARCVSPPRPRPTRGLLRVRAAACFGRRRPSKTPRHSKTMSKKDTPRHNYRARVWQYATSSRPRAWLSSKKNLEHNFLANRCNRVLPSRFLIRSHAIIGSTTFFGPRQIPTLQPSTTSSHLHFNFILLSVDDTIKHDSSCDSGSL